MHRPSSCRAGDRRPQRYFFLRSGAAKCHRPAGFDGSSRGAIAAVLETGAVLAWWPGGRRSSSLPRYSRRISSTRTGRQTANQSSRSSGVSGHDWLPPVADKADEDSARRQTRCTATFARRWPTARLHLERIGRMVYVRLSRPNDGPLLERRMRAAVARRRRRSTTSRRCKLMAVVPSARRSTPKPLFRPECRRGRRRIALCPRPRWPAFPGQYTNRRLCADTSPSS